MHRANNFLTTSRYISGTNVPSPDGKQLSNGGYQISEQSDEKQIQKKSSNLASLKCLILLYLFKSKRNQIFIVREILVKIFLVLSQYRLACSSANILLE